MQNLSGSSDGLQELNPVDVSMEAALELGELKQGGIRDDAPAFRCFVELLRTPSRGFKGEGISMLADVRSFRLFKESLGQLSPKLTANDHKQLFEVMNSFLADIELGVKNRDEKKIKLAMQFCLAFNSSLLGTQMNDIYARRERSDARYITNESVP
jgi:hypothetical protein